MRAAAAALTLVLAWAPAGYVRREWRPVGWSWVTVEGGSRDRRLAGKARRRARRAGR